MGLIKSAKGAISSTLGDQWKEAIRCDDMTDDILMMKKTTPTGVITSGSTIIVAPGQCAVVYDNGKVIDATAEDGIYTFDESSSPSFFAGQFKATFKEMWQRFLYNGETSKQQAVFYFNLKEIMDNKFGTSTPVPFQDWSHPIPNRMTNTISPLSVKIRCYGTYTFKLDNPAIFMQELAGTAEVYNKSSIVEQMRSEVMAAFQNILNELGNSEHKVPVLEMPSQTDEMKQILEERVFDEPIRRRGIKLVSFSVESVTLEEESEKKINDYELSSNSYLQQGMMTNAYANAVENAAQNSSGVSNGFMGIGMMNMMSGGMIGGSSTQAWQNQGNPGNTINYNPYENQQAQTNNYNTQPAQPNNNNEQIAGPNNYNAQPAQPNNNEQAVQQINNNEQPAQPDNNNEQVTQQINNNEQPTSVENSNETINNVEINNSAEASNGTETNNSAEASNNAEINNSVEASNNAEINNVEMQNNENQLKVCKKCGKENQGNANFCFNCGEPLNN